MGSTRVFCTRSWGRLSPAVSCITAGRFLWCYPSCRASMRHHVVGLIRCRLPYVLPPFPRFYGGMEAAQRCALVPRVVSRQPVACPASSVSRADHMYFLALGFRVCEVQAGQRVVGAWFRLRGRQVPVASGKALTCRETKTCINILIYSYINNINILMY